MTVFRTLVGTTATMVMWFLGMSSGSCWMKHQYVVSWPGMTTFGARTSSDWVSAGRVGGAVLGRSISTRCTPVWMLDRLRYCSEGSGRGRKP